MCGRYTVTSPGELVADLFELPEVPDLEPRYNVAPTQEAPVVRIRDAGEGRRLDRLRWGLVPYWADDPSIGNRLINARSETAAEKPAFKWSFRRRRCAVVADGFYEWQATDSGKRPWLVRLADGGPFALAGLWDRWRPEEGGEALESFTVLTTEPNELVRPIHDRMPVILEPGELELWLDPGEPHPRRLRELLDPIDSDRLEAFRVSKRVNSPANDDPECVEPVEG